MEPIALRRVQVSLRTVVRREQVGHVADINRPTVDQQTKESAGIASRQYVQGSGRRPPS